MRWEFNGMPDLNTLGIPASQHTIFNIEEMTAKGWMSVIGVGDYTCFKANSIRYSQYYYNGKVHNRRFTIPMDIPSEISVINPKGTLTSDLMETVRTNWYRIKSEPAYVHVEGDENTAVLASILLSPDGTFVLWGSDKGTLYAEVTPMNRYKALDILYTQCIIR